MNYLKIIYIIQFSRVKQETQVRLNFLVQNLGSFCFLIAHVLTFLLVLNVAAIPGWSRSELLSLLLVFEVFTYAAFFLFYSGFRNAIKDIHTGSLDAILVKPAPTRFLANYRGGSSHNFLAFIFSFILLIFHLLNTGQSVNLSQVIFFLLSLLISLATLANINWLFICANFSLTHLPKAADTIFEIQNIFKYPREILPPALLWQHVLLLPFLLLVSLPTRLLLGKEVGILDIAVYLSFAALSHLLASLSWKYGLEKYASAA